MIHHPRTPPPHRPSPKPRVRVLEQHRQPLKKAGDRASGLELWGALQRGTLLATDKTRRETRDGGIRVGTLAMTMERAVLVGEERDRARRVVQVFRARGMRVPGLEGRVGGEWVGWGCWGLYGWKGVLGWIVVRRRKGWVAFLAVRLEALGIKIRSILLSIPRFWLRTKSSFNELLEY